MKKDKRYLCLFISLLIVMVVLFTGCITVYEKTPGGKEPGTQPTTEVPESNAPIIKSFTADQVSINPGQQVQLSWEVSGATDVEIAPVVGSVVQLPANAVLVSPTETTTYTLTATNAEGNSTASVTVTVAPAAGNKPDLIITGIEEMSGVVYYTTKNIGGEASKGCRAYLYVNDGKEAETYIEPLAPGQERKASFSNYAWSYKPGGLAGQISPGAPTQYAVKVCADVQNVVVENDEGNNCKTVIWGQKFNYNFLNYAHMAWWYTGAGAIILPVPESNAKGYAGAIQGGVTLEDGKGHGSILMTIPQHVNDGWIKGEFAEFGTDQFGKTQLYYLKLPDMTRFSAMVGFADGTTAGSQARFIFQVEDETSDVILTQSVTATADGTLDLFDVDLSSLKYKYVAFILRVEAIGSAENIKPVWVDPRVLQP